MKFQILDKKEYSSRREVGAPTIRVNLHGMISLSAGAAKLLNFTEDKHDILLAKSEEDNHYYIAHPQVDLNGEANKVFTVRRKNNEAAKSKNPGYAFNCVNFISELKEAYDLALDKNKKKSIGLSIDSTPVEYKKMKFYKIF